MPYAVDLFNGGNNLFPDKKPLLIGVLEDSCGASQHMCDFLDAIDVTIIQSVLKRYVYGYADTGNIDDFRKKNDIIRILATKAIGKPLVKRHAHGYIFRNFPESLTGEEMNRLILVIDPLEKNVFRNIVTMAFENPNLYA
jgi:hypothetical protein